MGYKTTIDKYSGFCGGVIRAIERAEQLVDAGETLYSLGAVVHNNEELLRLGKKGLKVITKDRSMNFLPAQRSLSGHTASRCLRMNWLQKKSWN
jgi:4-hydroxy-3-methylbut-2-enyl diphosphate reductase